MGHQQGAEVTRLTRRASLAVPQATLPLPASMVGGVEVCAGAWKQRSAGIRRRPAAADRSGMEERSPQCRRRCCGQLLEPSAPRTFSSSNLQLLEPMDGVVGRAPRVGDVPALRPRPKQPDVRRGHRAGGEDGGLHDADHPAPSAPDVLGRRVLHVAEEALDVGAPGVGLDPLGAPPLQRLAIDAWRGTCNAGTGGRRPSCPCSGRRPGQRPRRRRTRRQRSRQALRRARQRYRRRPW